MEAKKHILLLTTGGTIACRSGQTGLEPDLSHILDGQVGQLRSYYRITVQDVMCLDSSNIRPTQWQQLARHIYEQRGDYDGIVVSHGTDTMAYTASALTFMLPGIDLPVVLTGSQLPLEDSLSDGPGNLRTAFAMAGSGICGVFIAFDRKVMLGCRAVKVRASDFAAFESVNARYVATADSRGLIARRELLPARVYPPKLAMNLSENVFLLKLTPGLDSRIFDALITMGYQGIVIEAFGLGGFNVLGEGLSGIRRAIEAGISVVVTTQCLYDSADLLVYQVGKCLLDMGVLQGRDMTSEAAMTKLMWALGQGMTPPQIKALFETNLAGEITLG